MKDFVGFENEDREDKPNIAKKYNLAVNKIKEQIKHQDPSCNIIRC